MKLLVVAPTIDRDDVGEAWVAYQWVERLSRRHELTVLTYRKRAAPAIRPQVPRARVVEWQEPPMFGRMERFNSLLKPGYFSFERKARKWIRAALRRGEQFDLGHQMVPVAMRYPSPLRGSGIPYVMGPVGGGLQSPAGFEAEETGPWYQRLRGLDSWRLHHDPALKRTYEEAACVFGIAPYVAEALRGLRLRRFEILSETALPVLPDIAPRRQVSIGKDRPLRLLFVGRVIRTKGARDLVSALAHLRDLPVVVDIVGDGFDLEACRELADELAVTDRVTFHGRKTRQEVEGFYRRADVFAFPSYREPGGNVVFEAMAHWLPLIVCNRGGPGAAVDSECAILLEPHTPDQLARDIATAVRSLAGDTALRQRMGEAARQRLGAVGLWEPKLERVAQIYSILKSSAAVESSRG